MKLIYVLSTWARQVLTVARHQPVADRAPPEYLVVEPVVATAAAASQ